MLQKDELEKIISFLKSELGPENVRVTGSLDGNEMICISIKTDAIWDDGVALIFHSNCRKYTQLTKISRISHSLERVSGYGADVCFPFIKREYDVIRNVRSIRSAMVEMKKNVKQLKRYYWLQSTVSKIYSEAENKLKFVLAKDF